MNSISSSGARATGTERPTARWFVVASAIYVVGIAVAVFRNWSDMIAMDPNEWADVAGGVFSPLAFLWFLYTALAQGAELRLQQDELKQNTAAQHDQERQLQRQADALDAQMVRMQAEAAAQYAPILLLETSSQGHRLDGRPTTLLHIRNDGAPVLDVVVGANAQMSQLVGVGSQAVSIRGGVLPHWPTQFRLELLVQSDNKATEFVAEDLTFELTITRLDLQTFLHRYRYINADQRIALLSVAPAQRCNGATKETK